MKHLTAASHCVTCSGSVVCYNCRKRLCDSPPEDANYRALPEERPGGFNWGEGRRFDDDQGAANNDL